MPEIGQLLSLEYGAALPAERRAGHGFPVFGSNGEVGRHDQPLVDGPGIVVGRKGSVGKVCWSEDPFWPIDTTYWVKCAAEQRRWIYWLLSRLPLGDLDSSTGVPGLNRNDVYELSVFEPPTGDEKSKIAEILDTLDTTIRQTEAIIEKLKQVKQGLLHDLLTRGIDANGELRPPQSQAPHLYKDSPLGWVPREWRTDALGRLAESSVIGPFGSDLVASDYRTHGVPVVFVRDVKADRFEWKSNVFVSAQKASALSAHEVRGGDVVATKMGFPPCVAAVFPDSMPSGVVTADIVRLRFDSANVRSHWVSLSINEAAVVKQVEQITAGVTRPKVTLRDVRNLCIRVPNVDEQDRILVRINNLGRRIEIEATMLSKLGLEKSGLMDDLLTGRVRVTPLLNTP